ncbi:MAG: transglycosylase domain-containing protein [Caldilineaceae bacterium]|nr:transglycosylase domain-containing protein [Caldilineaceae bacterium]
MKRIWGWGAVILVLLVAGIGIGVYATILADLPSIREIEARSVRPTTRILDRNGLLLYEVLDPNAGKQFNLSLVSAEATASRYGMAGVPDFCVEATLATEDSRFFLHPGVDPLAILRAAWQNHRAGGQIVSGGSTLTQQIARNLLMEPSERYERSLRRKIREAWLALQLEWRYSKPQLLQLYLNQTYYGNFAFGLEAAAQIFFAKPAAQLSRAECALLAGLVQYPTGYNPFQDAESAKLRQQTVLRLMRDAGYIDEAELVEVLADPLRYRSQLFRIEAPHFVMYIQDLLIAQLGADRLRAGGLEVWTTLDLGLQRQAEASVRRRLEQLNCQMETVAGRPSQPDPNCRKDNRSRRVRNAAAVVLDARSGDILSLVGSPNYFDASIEGNVNAALSQRQPGSAIKPFTYAAALDPIWIARAGLDRPLTPASILPDLPTAFPGGRGDALIKAMDGDLFEDGAYVPKNYDLRYHGPVSVREALANSYNIPAVHVLQYVGVFTMQQLATEAGIRSFGGEYGLALTLGGGEVSLLDLTKAYGIFPRGGERLETRAILEIRNVRECGTANAECGTAGGDSSRNSQFATRNSQSQVISPEAAYLITDILSDRVARIPAFGEGSVLNLPFPAAAKTGTTTDWRDNWTVGYSAERLVGVWVGNADNTPMQGISGIDGAGPIWQDIMRAAHPTPPAPFRKPLRIIESTICAPSGLLPSPDCPRLRGERFIAGSEPTRADDQFQRIPIDLSTGLRATAETPPERVVERVYWLLGPAYADWARAQGIPQPPPTTHCGMGIAECGIENSPSLAAPDVGRTQSALILTAPIGASAYAIHPGVPPERQRIPVGGYVADGRPWHSLRLVVNGIPILTAEEAVRLDGWWVLTKGEHSFWLEGESNVKSTTIRSPEVRIVVE